MSYESPVRSAIKTEILAALNAASAPLTAGQLADICPSAPDANEIARIAYEMRVKKGLLEFGDDALEPGKRPVKTYRITWPPTFVAPPPVADNSHLAQWTEIAEPPVSPEQADIDAALIAALQEVADDLPKSTDSPTEEDSMSQDPAIYAPEIALPQPAVGLDRDPPYHAADDTFVLKAIVEPKEAQECQGHCANHARDSELWDALRQDDEDDKLEEARLALVDSLLIYAHSVLHEDAVWKSLLRPYQVIAGASLEVCHG